MSDEERADPDGKARLILEGEGEKPSPYGWSKERRAAASERMRKAHAEGSAPKGPKGKRAAPPPVEITEQDCIELGGLLAVVWGLAGPAVKLAPLNEEEATRLGTAAAPVIQKYLPMLGDWKLEITLIMVTAGLVQAKRKEWELTYGLEVAGGAAQGSQNTEAPKVA